MTPDHPLPARHGWLIANLVAQLAFGLLAMTFCLPSMQEWPAEFGVSQAAVQLTFSGYLVAFGGMQLVYGAWSDRIGRKPVLMTGLVLACTGSVLAALSTELWVLTAARVLQGAGTAAGMVIGRAMVQDLFKGPERTRVMAFIGMSMGLCPPLAILLGGQVHARLGWQATFWIMAALAVCLMAVAWRALPDVRPEPDSTPRAQGLARLFGGYAELLREPVFRLYVAILATTAATFYTFLAGAPIVLTGYGIRPESIGLYIISVPISYVAGNALSTRLIPRFGERRIMMFGQVITVGGVLLVLAVALAGFRTPLALTMPLLLLGIGNGLLLPPTLIGTVGLLPGLAGSAAAVAGLLQQMSGALAGFAVGLVPHSGAVNLALLMLVTSSAALVAQVLLARTLRRRALAPAAA